MERLTSAPFAPVKKDRSVGFGINSIGVVTSDSCSFLRILGTGVVTMSQLLQYRTIRRFRNPSTIADGSGTISEYIWYSVWTVVTSGTFAHCANHWPHTPTHRG